MTILDWDDNVLDLKALRLGVNSLFSQKCGPLFDLYAPEVYNRIVIGKNHTMVVDENGVLTSNNTIDLTPNHSDGEELAKNLTRDGIITGVHAPILWSTVPYLNNSLIGSKVNCSELRVHSAYEMANLQVYITPDFNGTKANSHGGGDREVINVASFQYKWNDYGIDFENVGIEFSTLKGGKTPRLIRFCYAQEPSKLKGLKSNCERIEIYTLDDFPMELWDIFEMHTCKIHDREKMCVVDMPIKNMKKVISVANNPKRYGLEEHLLKLKPGARLGDILPLENFPELEIFRVENNNVSLAFVKKDSAVARPDLYSFSRIPTKLLGNPSMDEKYICTEDGWYVIITNRS